MLDHLHHVRAVNFRDPKLRKEHAPDIALKDLDRSMHITMSSGNFSGFDAFRKLTWHLPTLWPLIPLLYLPGIPPIGRFVYARIAASRNRCGDGYCIHETHSDR
ncbi:hypothetical protein A3B61_03690 [Candidatus Peribacteria bacterium RIFCSPLOWO2_01_FULL_53_10]|nr:MAG: hypothetical protein A3B61_03690 [Candidatus Peribacteria bacterium RIFCSPLOWO2_01_FULL_53_10]